MRNGVSVLFLAALVASTPAQELHESFSRLSMSGPPAMARATRLQEMEPDRPLHLSIGLKLADEAGLQAFVDSVSDPTSPNYRHFLTPNQVGQRFGASMDTVNQVKEFLSSQGMNVRFVSKNRLAILADATVAQAEAAFQTQLSYYSSSEVARVKEADLFGFTDKPMVPAAIAPYIQTIGGLENFTRPKSAQFVSPSQLRTLYGVRTTYQNGFYGQGRTVAVTCYDGFDLNNVALECKQFSLPTPTQGAAYNVNIRTVDPANTAANGTQSGEGDMDIQCVLAMAPLCNLIVYDGGPLANAEPIATLAYEADDNLADIVTESYGWPGSEDFDAICHDFHLSMNAQGMTNMASSGDHGTASIFSDPYPDVDPEVLIVGGTTVTTDEAGNRKTETAWTVSNEFNDGYDWGGGGGYRPTADKFNVLPPYQKGPGIPTNLPYRLTPDIALDADVSYEIFIKGVFEPSQGIAWGGTSAASSTFAGSLASVEGRLIAAGAFSKDSTGHSRFGRIQDLLYTANSNNLVFYDVVSGDSGTLFDGSQADAHPGWDFATGLGVLDWDGFYALVINTPSVSSLSINPTSVEGGASSTVQGTITLAAPIAKPNFTVSMSSSDPSVKVPASVAVPLGAKSVNAVLTTFAVSTSKTVTITAKYGTTQASATVTLTPPHLQSLSLSPLSVVGGVASTGTVAIPEAAPSGGTVVTLTSANSAVASVPATVTIAGGQTKATFNIATTTVSTSTAVKITASAGGSSPTATLTVTPAALSTLKLSASSFLAGQSATGVVTLSGAAPTGGVTVAISLSAPSLMTLSTSSVSIAAGASSGSFKLTANPVDAVSPETVTATLNGVTRTSSIAIDPSELDTVTSSTSSLIGGNSATIAFSLNAPAGPSGVKVTISATPTSDASFSSTTLTIPSGSSRVTAVLKTAGVTQDSVVTVSGTAIATKLIGIVVQAATLKSFAIAPTTVKGNGSNKVTASLSLSGTTGPTARTVTLSSSSTSANLPASVVIPANASSVTFSFVPSAVTANTAVTLTATLAGQSLTQTLTITP